MILIDVNILVYAYRADAPEHSAYRQWLEEQLNSDQAYGFSDLVLTGFLRIVTHPRIFNPPSNLESAFDFVHIIRSQPNAVPIMPGLRHWDIFQSLCKATGAKGNMLPDAYLAALAIESGSEWITSDRDFSRFPNLKWRPPFRN